MKRTYVCRVDPDTNKPVMIEVTAQPTEWINTGTRYGSETLGEMKRKGLVPPSDFTETWAKAEAERKRLRGELPETTAMREDRRAFVREAMDKVRAGYKPPKRDSSWLK